MAITTESELNEPDFTMRTIILNCKNEVRKVNQFCCLKWPESGYPDTTALLIALVKAVRRQLVYGGKQSTPPIVVHSCAGVGRTGTFIAVDHLLQQIRDHDDVDIYKLVLEMRNQRCDMVQTDVHLLVHDQYVYIYECLRDFICIDEDSYDDDDDDSNDNIYEHILATPDHVYEDLKL